MPEVVDGFVTLGEEPGWGIEIEPQFLATAQHLTTTS
jgi:L-alanine-DL-glutamate epimerase-like enolase superfamily enzyme